MASNQDFIQHIDDCETMKQIERISKMEHALDHASAAVMELSAALDKYAAVQNDIANLSDYYSSDDWKHDFADDEAGRLPATLKRGVLSEDGLWNLLTDNHELQDRMKQLLHSENRYLGSRNGR